ncbi:MAG: asparagine synthase (glutamine-hydrolyzing) [Bacteroidetes bacterium]|nr:asparagine synthase (glutamine-hydrolyzing) [Bacteroidota bacterium]
MCGINGFYSNTFNQDALLKMNLTLSHRGPDAEGFFFDESSGAGLGHTRLSILDLSDAANQPFHSSNNRYVMAYNGEVYNFKEIAQELNISLKTTSDTEVILEAFVKWGPEFVNRLNGMFALAIYDKAEKQMFLFRDRLGIKPLFYYLGENSLVFASELKAIQSLKEIKNDINPKAVYDFLHLGYIPEPHSIYQNIYKFPAGHFAVFDGKNLSIKPYWKIEEKFKTETQKDFKKAKSEFKDLMESAVKYRMISDVPFGTFLSGGIDSSLVTAIAQKLSDKPIKTFTIGFKDAKFNEAEHAKKVSHYLKTDHHEQFVSYKDAIQLTEEIIDSYDEPFADSSAIPTMLVSKMAREHVTMTLSGDGGDELFMGYGWYKWAKRLNKPFLKSIPFSHETLAKIPISDKYKRALNLLLINNYNFESHIVSQEHYLFSQSELQKLLLNNDLIFTPDINFDNLPRKLNQMEKQALYDIKYYLKDDLLVKVDRASMKSSLEARVPLLDYRIVEFALNLDESMKYHKGELKYFLKQVLYDYVPEEYFNRPKWGFSIPLSLWMKNELKYLITDFLSPEIINRYGIVSVPYTKMLINRFFKGDNYLYNRLWALIILHKFLSKNH